MKSFAPALQRAQLVIGLGGHDEHRQVAVFLDFLQPVHHLEAVHARHLEIEQDQVVAVLAVKLADLVADSSSTRRRHSRRRAASAPAAATLAFQVVDDQDVGVQDVGSD